MFVFGRGHGRGQFATNVESQFVALQVGTAGGREFGESFLLGGHIKALKISRLLNPAWLEALCVTRSRGTDVVCFLS